MSPDAFIQQSTLDRAITFAKELGVDTDAFFRSKQMATGSIRSNERIANGVFAQFLQFAADALQDPQFGLKAGATFHPSDLGAYGYLVVNAPTVRDALSTAERMIAFQQDGGLLVSRQESPGEFTLLYDGGELVAPLARLDAEFSLALIHAIVSRLVPYRVSPRLVRVRYPSPMGGAELSSFFGCSVWYSAPDTAIVYDASMLDQAVRSADPHLYRILSEFVVRDIERLPPRRDVQSEVRWWIRQLLPGGGASLDAVAHHLGASRRTLQRRLKESRSEFRHLLDQVRLEMFDEFERSGSATRSEVAHSLGLSDASALFKWRTRQRFL